jgi:helicase, putative, RecD/TraA family
MKCRFERAIFQSAAGYCVFSYNTADSSVPAAARTNRYYSDRKIHFTATGVNLPATDAIEVELDGTWVNSKYGLQLSVTGIRQLAPTNIADMEAYLCCGLIKGIGPETAKAIVSRFGADSLEILDKKPEELLTVKGIADTKLRRIVDSYQETKTLSELMLFLAPYGVSTKKAALIRDSFGDDSLRIVKEDPFQLCRVKGFGFMTVDSIARKTKVSLKHPLRYSGAVNYVLDEARLSGDLFLSEKETVSRCHELLNRGCGEEVVSEQEIKAALTNERLESRVYVDGSRVYLSYERMCEVKTAKRVVSMLLDEDFRPIANLQDRITAVEARLAQELSQSQRQAVELCLSHPLSIMTGGPGTGKTTTLRFILEIYRQARPGWEILLAAPTGRASRRMEEQTGVPASTIHSALGLITDDDSFLNDDSLLSADLVVIDEFSMVDMRLAYALFSRLKPGCQMIIVGDADQLPSVGAGNVLREFIRCGLIPTAALDTVFRQAHNSRIAVNAQAVNHNDTHLQYGEDFQILEANDAEEAAQLVIRNYLSEIGIHGTEGVQILTPFRKKGAVSANALNEKLRELVNPADKSKPEVKSGAKVYRVGDRIIQTCNRNGVSNGDVGFIFGIRDNDGEPEIQIRLLDGRELTYTLDMMEDTDLSYCLTIHKSQGSEYPSVIIPLLKEHYIMLHRNLLYTAITRAKEKVILIGQKQAVYMAIHKCDVDERNTVLADRINAYYDREVRRCAS